MKNPLPRPNWHEHDSDEALLQASHADGDAFAVLVGRYEKRLYGLLWRLCPKPDELDDLYQQVWIRAWGARLSFEGRSKFGTWLYAIALNQVREWRRKQKPQVDIDSLPEPELRQPNALDRLLGRARDARLQAHLQCLSDKDREILSLRYLQDLDYAEVAALQKTSLAQVRLRAFRALQRLKTLMKERD